MDEIGGLRHESGDDEMQVTVRVSLVYFVPGGLGVMRQSVGMICTCMMVVVTTNGRSKDGISNL